MVGMAIVLALRHDAEVMTQSFMSLVLVIRLEVACVSIRCLEHNSKGSTLAKPESLPVWS